MGNYKMGKKLPDDEGYKDLSGVWASSWVCRYCQEEHARVTMSIVKLHRWLEENKHVMFGFKLQIMEL